MENVNTKFVPNYQSVCPVLAGHLQQALPCFVFFMWPPPFSSRYKEGNATDLSIKAPTKNLVSYASNFANCGVFLHPEIVFYIIIYFKT